MNVHDWFFQQTSQALGFLSMLGVAASIVRWKTALRRDILLSFAIYLCGSSLREVVVYIFSFPDYWTPTAYTLSGISRVIQLVGVGMFLHAALSEHCRPWVLWALLSFVAAFVLVV